MSHRRAVLSLVLALKVCLCADGMSAADSCVPPPVKNFTKPFNQSSFGEKMRLRYTCIDGYLRKAGTSSLIRCSRTGSTLQWDNVNGSNALICIPDPRKQHDATVHTTTKSTPVASASPEGTIAGYTTFHSLEPDTPTQTSPLGPALTQDFTATNKSPTSGETITSLSSDKPDAMMTDIALITQTGFLSSAPRTATNTDNTLSGSSRQTIQLYTPATTTSVEPTVDIHGGTHTFTTAPVEHTSTVVAGRGGNSEKHEDMKKSIGSLVGIILFLALAGAAAKLILQRHRRANVRFLSVEEQHLQTFACPMAPNLVLETTPDDPKEPMLMLSQDPSLPCGMG